MIEDCAQAHGATYKGAPVGSLGDIAAFSFCQDKIMTTSGEGGMVTTDNDELWKRTWSIKDHGKDYDTVYNKSHPPGFRWLHREKAFDIYRLNLSQKFPIAKELMDTGLMFLVHPTLTKRNIAETISAVQKVMAKAAF